MSSISFSYEDENTGQKYWIEANSFKRIDGINMFHISNVYLSGEPDLCVINSLNPQTYSDICDFFERKFLDGKL